MPTLSIDIETFSEVDLPKAGVYAYSDHPSFEILLFAYAFDDEPTEIIDLKCGEQLSRRVLDALTDPACTKTAFNAAFERTCISRHLGVHLKPESWQCTAVQSAIVQAIARDLLALAMLRIRNAGYEIVMHIHDEAVLEVPIGESSVDEICAIMGEAPAWASGLPLRADGYECDFYRKD